MNKYYEKLKCFFSLNYQLKKLAVLSEGNYYFHVDIHVYKHIIIINMSLVNQFYKNTSES